MPPSSPPAWGTPPPPPPPAAPSGYGGPGAGYGYGYPAPAQTEGTAIGALVCAIVGLIVCGVVLGVVGLVLANSAQQKIDASGGRLTGSGLVTAARVISIVDLVTWALFMLVFFASR